MALKEEKKKGKQSNTWCCYFCRQIAQPFRKTAQDTWTSTSPKRALFNNEHREKKTKTTNHPKPTQASRITLFPTPSINTKLFLSTPRRQAQLKISLPARSGALSVPHTTSPPPAAPHGPRGGRWGGGREAFVSDRPGETIKEAAAAGWASPQDARGAEGKADPRRAASSPQTFSRAGMESRRAEPKRSRRSYPAAAAPLLPAGHGAASAVRRPPAR